MKVMGIIIMVLLVVVIVCSVISLSQPQDLTGVEVLAKDIYKDMTKPTPQPPTTLEDRLDTGSGKQKL